MKMRLKLAVCLIISLSHLDLPSIQADNQKTTSSKIKDKQKADHLRTTLAIFSIITLGTAGAVFVYHQQGQNNHEQLPQNKKKETYDEEKRIVRVNKDKISSVVPKIFRQTIEKLEVLKPEEVGTLQNGVQTEIDKNKEQFLDNYLKRSYKIDINDGSYIGTAMMKFKDDIKNKHYLYVACLVKIKEFSDGNNAVDIKNKINKDMEARLNLELQDPKTTEIVKE